MLRSRSRLQLARGPQRGPAAAARRSRLSLRRRLLRDALRPAWRLGADLAVRGRHHRERVHARAGRGQAGRAGPARHQVLNGSTEKTMMDTRMTRIATLAILELLALAACGRSEEIGRPSCRERVCQYV